MGCARRPAADQAKSSPDLSGVEWTLKRVQRVCWRPAAKQKSTLDFEALREGRLWTKTATEELDLAPMIPLPSMRRRPVQPFRPVHCTDNSVHHTAHVPSAYYPVYGTYLANELRSTWTARSGEQTEGAGIDKKMRRDSTADGRTS